MTKDNIVYNNEIMYSDCPVCGGEKTLEITNRTDNIPYFGDMLETAVSCKNCGYQSSDSISLEHNEPMRFKLKIDSTKLSSRVAKSQTATISIPDLGLKVEPGPKSQGYVSNVEGILNRFESAVLRAIKLEGEEIDPDVQDKALDIIDYLTRIKMGEMSALLILEDPFGNSVIDDDDVDKEILTPEEAEKLQTGFATFDQSEVE
ncbi:MAG: ZPR1 zinc finger domain-containing protein [Methanosphaera sp.]|uniref:ZPR1 zinc finger domain-containing protein n=1 Tax=Methanosphaera sp. TaxID=2666342 RepID=UPI002E77FE56|nr:ZPR1 zinc finger domain-containing protein [Methanosphaera sp.]MEE1116988.1 ZPR1 zinc finger domain-containing protein [Methanosphaera sp.]MEE3324370.1 ZPR1 zinc finger domain-containing protein [Methanosphaera sp.]MEE3418976.1 ZPR1 zinc finger domain-containing protein [Methanosphaera sp.]